MANKTTTDTWVFAAQLAGAFIVTIIVLGLVGLLPKELRPGREAYVPSDAELGVTEHASGAAAPDTNRGTDTGLETSAESPRPTTATLPTYISIPAIGTKASILHPSSPRVEVLDAALQKGAVYYPGSGTIEEGNMFIFGHSTNWAVVQNQAYKTFNNLDELAAGAEILLTANGKTYVYEVETVTHVDANTAFVDLSRPGRRLTISTCDTFGAKSDRWVVDAVFKEVR
jgi:LPXTG-site transpeptidase (sortase) family protein